LATPKVRIFPRPTEVLHVLLGRQRRAVVFVVTRFLPLPLPLRLRLPLPFPIAFPLLIPLPIPLLLMSAQRGLGDCDRESRVGSCRFSEISSTNKTSITPQISRVGLNLLHAACLNPLHAALGSSTRQPPMRRTAGHSGAPRPAPTIPRPWPFWEGEAPACSARLAPGSASVPPRCPQFPVARRERRPARYVFRQARIRLAACCVPVARRGHRPAREGLVFETPRPDVQFMLVDRSTCSLPWDALFCTARCHRGLPCSGCAVWNAFPQKRSRRCMNNARAASRVRRRPRQFRDELGQTRLLHGILLTRTACISTATKTIPLLRLVLLFR